MTADPFRGCDYLFSFTHVPIFRYENDVLVSSYPTDISYFAPPSSYRSILRQQLLPAQVRTDIGPQLVWGRLELDHPSHELFFGPMCTIELTDAGIDQVLKDYASRNNDIPFFKNQLLNIPRGLPQTLWNLICFADHTFNEGRHKLADVYDPYFSVLSPQSSTQTESVNTIYSLTEEALLYDNVQLESQFTTMIEHGEVEQLREFAGYAHAKASYGSIAVDDLRQLKNTALIMITLASRASVRGGLPAGTAYALSDMYMRQVEKLPTVDQVLELMPKIQIDYATHVAEARKAGVYHVTRDMDILKSLSYIHKNVNLNLKVDDVAQAVGLSRVHFTRKFTQEIGVSPSNYIRIHKLETKKKLLLYSDKTISEISFYLGFSSQSHFQKLFKEEYGITPMQCRRNL